MNGKKILFLVKTLLVAACLLFGAAVFTACGVEQGKDFPSITFTSEASGDLGEYYRLEMAVPSGVTVEGVSVKNSMNERVLLDEDYGFTPVNYGLYVYSVDARFKEQTKTFTFKVTVADKDAPVITRAPENVTVDCGLYGDFAGDLSTMEVVCKNRSLAEFLTIKAIKIDGNGVSVTDENGFSSFVFDKKGDYTVTVKVETLNGKSANCTYVINVKDGKNPVISISENVFTWVSGGKITIPQPRVYDFSNTELTYKAEKLGAEQTVADGKVAASAGDVFKVTYTATDESGNKASATTNVYAVSEGTVISGGEAAFASVIKAGEGIAEFINGALYVQSGERKDEFSFKGSAYAYTTERDYASVKLDIYNEQSANVTLGLNAHYGAAKVRVGEISLITGANVKYVPVENAKDITGFSFEAVSDRRIKLKINGVSFAAVTGGNEVNETLKSDPKQTIDVSDDAVYNLKTSEGNAFTKKSSDVFGSNANVMCSAISAYSVNSGVFSKSVAAQDVNYTEISVYSPTFARVTFGLIVNGNKTVFINARLVKGVNAVKAYVVNPEIKSIDGLSFKNNEAYDVEVYVGAINFYKQTAVSDSEVFLSGVGAVTLKYGERLVVPEIINFNAKAISALRITLKKSSTIVATGLSVGENFDIYSLNSPTGAYKLVYSVTDVFGEKHEKTVNVTARSKEFYPEIRITEDYYTGDLIELPDPVITGSLYNTHASEVKVNKYYRVEGGTQWLSADEGFRVYSNMYVDVKYSVYVEGVVSEIAEKTVYVHGKDVTFDYEQMADGTHLGVADDYDPNYRATISSNWSHDGKYSLFMQSGKYFDIFAGMIFPGGVKLDKTCNAVIFYAYSEKDVTGPVSIGVATEKGWSEDYVNIKKGEHKYIVPLPREFSAFTKFGAQIKRGEDYYIDSVTFDRLLDLDLNISDDSIISNKEFSLARPTITAYSRAAFNAKQVKGAQYTVEIVNERGETSDYTFKTNELKLTLSKGRYDLTYKVTVAGFTFSEKVTISVTDLPVKFFTPQTGFNANTEYAFKMPEVTGVTADKKLEYKRADDTEWLIATDGKITFNTFGKYQLKFTVSAGEKSDFKIYNAVVRDAYTLLDLELDAEGNHYGWFNNPYERVASDTEVSDEWSADGDYSLKVIPIMDSWAGVDYRGAGKSKELPEECGFIEFWMKASVTVSSYELEVRGGGITATAKFNRKAGEHKYSVQLSKKIKTIDGYLIFRSKAEYGTFYVDAVKFFNVKLDFPTDIPTAATVNKQLTVSDMPVENGTVIVKYKNASDADYKIANKVEGGYAVTFTELGMGEIVYTVNTQNAVVDKTYKVSVEEFAVNWQILHTGVNAGESITVINPAIDAETKVTTSYKLKDAAEWTAVAETNGKFVITFEKAGDYVIKQVAALGDKQIEKEYAVYARSIGSILDFETDESGNHYGMRATLINPDCFEGGVTDAWSANGKYSFFVKPTNNAWAGIDYSDNPIVLEQATDKFEIWVNAVIAVKGWQLEIHDGTGWIPATIDLLQGAHKYTVTFNKAISKIVKIDFRANGAQGTDGFTDNYYVDGFTALYGEQSTRALSGETVTGAALTLQQAQTDLIAAAKANGYAPVGDEKKYS